MSTTNPTPSEVTVQVRRDWQMNEKGCWSASFSARSKTVRIQQRRPGATLERVLGSPESWATLHTTDGAEAEKRGKTFLRALVLALAKSDNLTPPRSRSRLRRRSPTMKVSPSVSYGACTPRPRSSPVTRSTPRKVIAAGSGHSSPVSEQTIRSLIWTASACPSTCSTAPRATSCTNARLPRRRAGLKRTRPSRLVSAVSRSTFAS